MKTKTSPEPIRPPIVARKLWEVRHEDGSDDLHADEMGAQHAVELAEDAELAASMAPVAVLPADAASLERMAEQIARATDGLAFRIYKEGDCLPRGHEMDDVAKVNEVQVWRQRSALSNARKALRSLGILPTP